MKKQRKRTNRKEERKGERKEERNTDKETKYFYARIPIYLEKIDGQSYSTYLSTATDT